MLEALNADDKDLIDEYSYRLFTFLESAQRTSNAERCVLLSKEDGISRDSDQKYIFYLQLRPWEHLWH